MGRIFDHLKAAGGEETLNSLIGRWRQEVSQAIDGILGLTSINPTVLAALLTPAEFSQADSTLAQDAVGLNTDIVLNRELTARGVTYNPATGVFTLNAGKIYHLVANGRFGPYSDAVGGGLAIDWVNAADNTPLPTSVSGVFAPSTSTDPGSASPVVRAIHTAAIGSTTVKLRVTDATGTAVMPAARFTAAVIEVK